MNIKFLSIILCSVLSFFSISNRNEVKNIKVGKNTISVMFFGAMGDGVTDDSDAFQKAIVYCVKNNKTLYVPRTSTNYRLNKTIRVSLSSHDKIKIISNQAVIMPEIINSSSAYKLTSFTENVFLSIGR